MKLFPQQVKIIFWGVIYGLAFFAGQVHAQASWPPVIGEVFSQQEWTNFDGKKVRMPDYKGKVVVVEFVGMTCPACQAFSGAHHKGAYQGIAPQQDLRSIEEYFPQHNGGVSLSDDRVVFVQILLYSMSMKAPTPEDATAWAKHFGLDQKRNVFVVVASDSLIGPASYNLIPGFALLDKKGIVRSLSAGDYPKQNLYADLLPLVPKLLNE